MAVDYGPRGRSAPVALDPESFRELGHQLVDALADFLTGMPMGPVTRDERPSRLRALLPEGSLPEEGRPAAALLEETLPLLARHSLFNGHPRFWGYVTASPTPIGALGDLMAATLNPNLGGWHLAPIASELELQTLRWIAELVGWPEGSGGVFGSGGNMANYVGVLAARRAKADWDVRAKGLRGGAGPLTVYASDQTHTWLHKAADMFGLGLEAIRWIPTDGGERMQVDALEEAVRADRAAGRRPFLVVGTAGTVSTGAVDPLAAIADVCRRHDLWFHVDGAYGGFAASLPELAETFEGLDRADSLALDPHKWLYSPIDAGCTLVRDPQHLIDAFAFRPAYYHFDQGEEPLVNFHELGMENSRPFRALKVWLGLRQAGRSGVVSMIRDDIALSREMHAGLAAHPEIETATQALSISTFRYVPPDVDGDDPGASDLLNRLNTELLERLQAGGHAFVSNAVLDGRFLLRACIVNYRTQRQDVQALTELVVDLGRAVRRELRG